MINLSWPSPTLAGLGLVAVLIHPAAHAQTKPGEIEGGLPMLLRVDGLADATLTGGSTFVPGARRLQLRTTSPVLCTSFGGSTGQTSLELRDANNDLPIGAVNGISSISYLPGTRRLSLTTDASFDCMLPAAIGAPAGGGVPELLDLIFASGADPGVSGIDLQVSFSAGVAVAGQNLVYSITVRNIGAANADGVHVRDFYPKQTGGFSPHVGDGSWTCAPAAGAPAGSRCGNAGPVAGTIAESTVDLPGNGGAVVYTVTRPVGNNPVPPAGSTLEMAAAAFVDRGDVESSPANNAIRQRYTIVTNIAPTISPLANQNGLEDQPISISPISIGDTDGNPALVTMSATSSNVAVVPNAQTCILSEPGFCFGGSGTSRTLTVKPIGHAYTTAPLTVTVSANDGQPGGIATRSFEASFAPVNDAPSFGWRSDCPTSSSPAAFTYTPANGDDPAQITFPALTQTFFACENFVLFNPGPGEGDQTLLAVTPQISGSPIFSSAPQFVVKTGARIQFALNGQSGSADLVTTVTDSGGTASGGVNVSGPQTLRITVLGTPPTISDIANDSILEDNPSRDIGFTVGDAQTPVNDLVVTAQSQAPEIVPNVFTCAPGTPGICLAGAGAARTIRVTPVADANGAVPVRVTVTDSSQATAFDDYTVTVTPVNDPPSFSNLGNQAHPAEAFNLIEIPGWAANRSFGPANELAQGCLDPAACYEVYDFVLISGDDPFVPPASSRPRVTNDGLLRYVLSGAVGVAEFKVRLRDDGGTENGGNNTSAPLTVRVTTTAP